MLAELCVSHPLPQLSGQSLGLLSATAATQNFSMVTLFCLAPSPFTSAQKDIPIPPDSQTELHKVKTSPLIKVTAKQSNLFGVFFFLFSRIMGFLS